MNVTQTTRTDTWALDPDKILAARMEAGLKQTALARLAGISRQHLNDIEAGRRKGSPGVRRAIADALDVPMVDLLAEAS